MINLEAIKLPCGNTLSLRQTRKDGIVLATVCAKPDAVVSVSLPEDRKQFKIYLFPETVPFLRDLLNRLLPAKKWYEFWKQ